METRVCDGSCDCLTDCSDGADDFRRNMWTCPGGYVKRQGMYVCQCETQAKAIGLNNRANKPVFHQVQSITPEHVFCNQTDFPLQQYVSNPP